LTPEINRGLLFLLLLSFFPCVTQLLSFVFGSLFSVTEPVNHKNLASMIGRGATGIVAASDRQFIVDK